MSRRAKWGNFPCPARNLVPHRHPMLLVSELLFRRENDALVSAIAPEAGFFVSGGQVVPEYLIELVAQAMATVNGYDALQEGKGVPGGFLAGIDRFQWKSLPRAGEKLQIHVKKVFQFGQVTIMRGEVLEDDKTIAQGDLKVWVQED